ncbi:chromosome partitioning protein, ParB family [Alistipes timonensis JC136]|uniref:Chromosome partitioning protein, ParB family n=1 Tax=Alistipes timonensis JC136 TaxID=1033731 RepID=A0A1H4D3V6_9BACT|nr:ParB/RepB/Spo0J family partition protein [Alistipes timonensis]SEA66992.1 chromosome partitioning protein, ParB family [Alistipes timonensis JC136]
MKTNETNTTTATAAQSTKSTVLLSIDKIRPNPNNPRRSYDENALAELAASIATHGLIQPIRVRAAEQGGYIIVCGERRYHAVQPLGQTEIEAIVDAAPANERAIFDLALSENIQREEMPSLKTAQACSAASRTAASCTRCGTIFPNGLSSCYAGRYIVKYAHCTMADKSWNDLPATPENCKL